MIQAVGTVTGQARSARFSWNGSAWARTADLDVHGVIQQLVGGPAGTVAVVGSSYYRSGDARVRTVGFKTDVAPPDS